MNLKNLHSKDNSKNVSLYKNKIEKLRKELGIEKHIDLNNNEILERVRLAFLNSDISYDRVKKIEILKNNIAEKIELSYVNYCISKIIAYSNICELPPKQFLTFDKIDKNSPLSDIKRSVLYKMILCKNKQLEFLKDIVLAITD